MADTAKPLVRSPGYTEEEEAFFRQLVWSEEERPWHTTAEWRGEFRWFKSDNVVPFEKYRRPIRS
jgi:hypothetical protein